jgi:hypothetical protein
MQERKCLRKRRSVSVTAGVAAAALALAAGACGDGTGPGNDAIPAELAAVWVAEPACLPLCGFALSSVANPADSVNVTACTGITTEITMTRQGSFRLRTRPGPDTAAVGSVQAFPSLLVVTDAAGVVDTLDYQLAGDYLQLKFRRTFAVFDFDGDGVNDPAHARGSFRRR